LSFLNKLERKFGKYAIHNIIIYLLYISVAFFIVMLLVPNAWSLLALDPVRVLRGELWRLITFIFIPITPTGSILTDILYAVFGFLFMNYIGRSLESIWGSFRTNIYILISVVIAIIISLLFRIYIPGSFFIFDSLFLAFAYEFPNNEIRIYFIIPIKIKYLAFLRIAFMVYSLVFGSFTDRMMILLTVLAFLAFYLKEIIFRIKNRGVGKIRKVSYQMKATPIKKDTMHKCEICKITEKDDPNMEFRYCSKCNGNHEYCANHLFTHIHIK